METFYAAQNSFIIAYMAHIAIFKLLVPESTVYQNEPHSFIII